MKQDSSQERHHPREGSTSFLDGERRQKYSVNSNKVNKYIGIKRLCLLTMGSEMGQKVGTVERQWGEWT